MPLSTYWKAALERVVWTFVQAAAGVLIDQLTQDAITWRAIVYAGAIAALKVVVARGVGDKDTPSIP